MMSEPQWGQRGGVVVLTGATGYLGRALARAFADAGATLLLTARCETKLAHLAEELAPCGVPIHTVAADLTDPAAGERIGGAALQLTGRIDALVLNAGTLADGLVAALDVSALVQVLDPDHALRAAPAVDSTLRGHTSCSQ